METLTQIAFGALRRSPIDPAAQSEARTRERYLVSRAQGGDMAAFEELYRANSRRVFGLCLRIAADPHVAEELAQDVFVKAWQKIGTFRGESAFGSWLHPMAVNLALSERRSRKRRLARVTPVEDPTLMEKPPQKALEPMPGYDLDRALATLPKGARSVFVLHDVEGYKHEEIAAMTGVAAGTSKAQLFRARRLLREALGR